MHVALVGPCSPADVAALMDRDEASRARQLPGYRGVPVSELAKGLVDAGHMVTVVSTDSTIPVPAIEFTGPGFSMVVQRLRVRPRDYLRDLYAVERKGIAGVLRDTGPDIVHAHWTYEFELAAQDSGFPHVTTAHDAPVTILRQMRDPYRAARLAVAARARPGIRHLSAVAPYLATRWRREMMYRRPIEVIPNSIPTDALPEHLIRAPHPVLLEVADAGERKNIRGLLAAFERVRAQVSDSELRLVGPGLGPDDALAMWARSQGLARGVTFVGRLGRIELREEYGQAWVFVHASFEEACPMTLLEAHGARLPIIGGRASGGVPYVLDFGRAGMLTDVADPSALAHAMIDAISGGTKSVAPPESIARFTPTAVASAYASWYSESIHT